MTRGPQDEKVTLGLGITSSPPTSWFLKFEFVGLWKVQRHCERRLTLNETKHQIIQKK